jgi:hypothetical protein
MKIPTRQMAPAANSGRCLAGRAACVLAMIVAFATIVAAGGGVRDLPAQQAEAGEARENGRSRSAEVPSAGNWRAMAREANARIAVGDRDGASELYDRIERMDRRGLSGADRREVDDCLAYHRGLLASYDGDPEQLALAESLFEQVAGSTDKEMALAARHGIARVRLAQADHLAAEPNAELERLRAALDEPAAAPDPAAQDTLAKAVEREEQIAAEFLEAVDLYNGSAEAGRLSWEAGLAETRANYYVAIDSARQARLDEEEWRRLVAEAQERLAQQQPPSQQQQQDDQPGEGDEQDKPQDPREDEGNGEQQQQQEGEQPQEQQGDQQQPGENAEERQAGQREGEEGQQPRPDEQRDAEERPGEQADSSDQQSEQGDAPPPELPDGDPRPAPTPTPAPTPGPQATPSTVGEQPDADALADQEEQARMSAAGEQAEGAETQEQAAPAGPGAVYGMTPDDARSVLATFDNSLEPQLRRAFLRSHRVKAKGSQEEKPW